MSIYAKIGIPDGVGIFLFCVCFALLLSPYMGGMRIASIDVPDFPEKTKKRLKYIGPIALFISIALFLPIWPANQPKHISYNDNAQEKERFESQFMPLVLEARSYIDLCNNAIRLGDTVDAKKQATKLIKTINFLAEQDFSNEPYKSNAKKTLRELNEKLNILKRNNDSLF